MVKPGDVLENGLVVKSASCIFKGDVTTDGTKHTILPRTSVEFENTLTLTGILYCQAENIGYKEEGELFFFADSTENSQIPVIDYDFSSGTDYYLRKWFDPDSRLALMYDGSRFKVGSLDDVSCRPQRNYQKRRILQGKSHPRQHPSLCNAIYRRNKRVWGYCVH